MKLTYTEAKFHDPYSDRLLRKKRISFKDDVTKINLADKEISHIDLSPLSKCTDLKALFLGKNLIQEIDLSPLHDCRKLSFLDLSHNRISTIDLSPLSDNRYLRRLWLNNNQLQTIDLAPLASCPNLVLLDMGYNKLKHLDVTALIWKYKFAETLDVLHYGNNFVGDNISSWLDPRHSEVWQSRFAHYSRPSGVYPWSFLHQAAIRFKNIRRVYYDILLAMGLGEYGFIEGNPMMLFLSIPPSTPLEKAREQVIPFIVQEITKSVDKGWSTTGLDLEVVKERHEEIAKRYDRIVELRTAEMERVTIGTFQESTQKYRRDIPLEEWKRFSAQERGLFDPRRFDLTELHITAHGYETLRKLGVQRTTLNSFEIDNLVQAFRELGFELKISQQATPGAKMSKWLKRDLLGIIDCKSWWS